jgi:hypothetical protein
VGRWDWCRRDHPGVCNGISTGMVGSDVTIGTLARSLGGDDDAPGRRDKAPGHQHHCNCHSSHGRLLDKRQTNALGITSSAAGPDNGAAQNSGPGSNWGRAPG